MTILDEKGVPTPVVHSRLPGTRSRMDPASADLDATAKASPLWATYGTRTEAESARELLAARLRRGERAAARGAGADVPSPRPPRSPTRAASPTRIGDFLNSKQGKQVQREVIRGIFGMLKKKL